MKKLLIVLSLIFLVGCTTTGHAYLPHTSRIFHAKKNCVGCYDPNPIVFQSVQAAANSSGIAPCSICIKTKQYTPPSSYSYNSLGTSTSPNLNTSYGLNQSSSLNNASPSIGIISTNPTLNNPIVTENNSYYGEISEATKRPKTVYVNGYYHKDGTYVKSHYRSPPRNQIPPTGITQSAFVPIAPLAPKPFNRTENLPPPKIYEYTPLGFPVKGAGILDNQYNNTPTKGFGILDN